MTGFPPRTSNALGRPTVQSKLTASPGRRARTNPSYAPPTGAETTQVPSCAGGPPQATDTTPNACLVLPSGPLAGAPDGRNRAAQFAPRGASSPEPRGVKRASSPVVGEPLLT